MAIDPLEATRAQIEIFARELEATGRKLSTVASKLNALAGFYRYAVIDELLDRDPMLNVRRPRIDRISTTAGPHPHRVRRRAPCRGTDGRHGTTR